MGDIIRRGTKERPRFYARYKENGQRKTKAVKVTTLGEARSILAAIETRIAKGEVGIVERTPEDLARKTITVRELGKKFYTEYTKPKLHDVEKYRKNAQTIFDVRIDPTLGARAAVSVTSDDVERLRDTLATEYEGSSVKQAMALLSVMFNWGRRKKYIDCLNPTKDVERPVCNESDDYLSLLEAKTLLAHASKAHPELYPMIATVLYTGARKGEVLGLKWTAVTFPERKSAGRVYIKASYDGVTKSGKARVVPMNPLLAPILRAWRDSQSTNKHNLVFPTVTGAMGSKYETFGLEDVITGAGCHQPADGKCWHFLRHTFASHFVMSGGSILTLQKLLGHSDIKTTMRYAHLAPDFMADEVARMSFEPAIADITPITANAQ